MTAMSAVSAMSAAGAQTLAHGIHYGFVLAGLLGIGLLVAPGLLARTGLGQPPADGHELRVADLRRRIAYGELATLDVPAAPAPTALSPRDGVAGSRTALPLAIVASAAAAGVHAAVAPLHLRHDPDLVVFFLLCAGAQVAWSARALRESTPGLLLAGLLGNVAVLTLWLVSRTAGIPGLAHGQEPFGPWDVTCAGFELAVVAVCAVRLRDGLARQGLAPWWAWTAAPRTLLAVAALLLATLSFSGASA